nr:MAG TPA: hypothetical protein [Bacteriophage sp.]
MVSTVDRASYIQRGGLNSFVPICLVWGFYARIFQGI